MPGLPQHERVLRREVPECDELLLGEVPVVVVDLHQHRPFGRAVHLHRGHEFPRLPGRDARIVPTAHSHQRRIRDAASHVFDAIHLVKRAALDRVLDRAVLHRVRRAIGSEFAAHGVRVPDIAHRGGEQVGPLRDGPADQDAAGTRAGSREPFGTGVTVLHEIFSAGNEIEPGIRLGGLEAGGMPRLALFSAAAHVRDRAHHAA